MAAWERVATWDMVSMASSFWAVRSITRVLMPNCSATSIPSSLSMVKFRLELQGRMMPSVFSQAILHRIPTRAEALPPLLPNRMPSAWASATACRINWTRFSVSSA